MFDFIKEEKGFTLIELIIVIAVISILTVVAIPSFIGVIDQAHEGTCISNRHNIELMFAVDAVQNPDLDLQEYLATVPDKFHCPTGGTYTADENDHVVCSEHTKGAHVPDPPPVTNPPDGIDPDKTEIAIDKNHKDFMNTITNPDGTTSEVAASDYVPWSSHVVGDYVIHEGVIYECIYTNEMSNSPTDIYHPHDWRIVGSEDGNAVKVAGTTWCTYKPGTTVVQNGTEYMYAPVTLGDFNHTSFLTLGPEYSPVDWIKLTTDAKNEYVKPQEDTILYKAHTTYQKGDVVWQHGRLYEATADSVNLQELTPASKGAWGWKLVE